MRYCLVVILALVFAGCTPAASVQPTLRGPVVPTRVIPPTETATQVAALPTDTPEASAVPPTDTAESRVLSPTDTPEPPSATPLPSDTLAPTVTDTPETTAVPPTDTPEPPSATPLPTDTMAPTTPNTPEPPPDTPIPVDTTAPTDTETPEITVVPPTETPGASPTPTENITNTPTYTPSPTSLPTNTPLPEPVLFTSGTSLFPAYIYASVVLNEVIYGSIDDQNSAVLATFNGTQGMVVDVTMNKEERGDLDPFLIILDPKGREVARNDDIDKDNHDSQIRGLTLPANGDYVLVATRYGQDFGESFGDFGLVVRESAPGTEPSDVFAQATGYNSIVTGTLNDDTPEQIYTFRATVGDVITLQMTKTSGDLDPNLMLTSNLGTPLVINDDNLLLGTLDSAIQGYTIPRNGYYSIIAGRYSGSSTSGGFRLKIARDSENAVGLDAIVDPVNSTTVTDEGKKFTGYTIGDQLDENHREHTLQTLLTFRLPPNDNGLPLQNASFTLEPCLETGGGFETLGAMTIYQDTYGRLSAARNLTHPLPGARILSTQASCAALDVTALVQDAYNNGDPDVQFRLLLRSHTDNGSEDQVQFTPRLHVTFGSQGS